MNDFTVVGQSGNPWDEASSNLTETSQGGEILLRLQQAGVNVPRVSPNGAVAAGTYCTLFFDAHNCESAFEAVRRYALPAGGSTPSTVAYDVYKVVLQKGVQYSRGRVKPAFGQLGGGFEVVIQDSLPAGSAELLGTLSTIGGIAV
ncbi:MAG: hypothetical protein GC165_00665 [Armatimonadetes bacterium]|nr:hypothetical protein [Armatimonadota bacterium]